MTNQKSNPKLKSFFYLSSFQSQNQELNCVIKRDIRTNILKLENMPKIVARISEAAKLTPPTIHLIPKK